MSSIEDYGTVSGEPGPYQSGNPITLRATFVEGTSPVDPATVVFNILQGGRTLTTYTYGTDDEVEKIGVGEYVCNLPNPWAPFQSYYEAVSTVPAITVPGEFLIEPSSVIPPVGAPGPVMPPCTAWLAGKDLVGLTGSQGLDPQQLDNAAVIVSMLGFECLGRRWSGLCGPVTVRPCQPGGCGNGLSGWGSWVWTWGYWEGSWGYGWGWGNDNRGLQCGCGYDSHVELAGYPVSQVTQVKIGGSVLPATFADSGAPTYRLDEWRYLTRLSDPDNPNIALHWPRCQRLDLDDDQPGTWSVSYLYGVTPPPPALEAARQLASQVMLAMVGQACQLPNNVRTLVRQGATIERITPLATELKTGATGMLLWDAAIAAYNPNGLRRPPSVFSPDLKFPVRVGNE